MTDFGDLMRRLMAEQGVSLHRQGFVKVVGCV